MHAVFKTLTFCHNTAPNNASTLDQHNLVGVKCKLAGEESMIFNNVLQLKILKSFAMHLRSNHFTRIPSKKIQYNQLIPVNCLFA